MNRKISQIVRWTLLFVSVFIISCDKDDPSPNNNYYVNSWIKQNMDDWYYWNSTLPATQPSKTMTPDAYFESLLNDADRFSWIQDNYQELLNSLKGVSQEAGYEFVLYKESETSDNVIAQVVYIKPNSPAAGTSLKRGDVITLVNNQQITVDNYRQVLADLEEQHTITFEALDVASESFGEPQTVTLNVVEYSENPNFLSTVIEVNDRKIGYFVYNFFASGPDNESKVYDEETESVFANFKSQGITDLVLDLRYNSGGSETSAKNLASLIGNNIGSDKVFVRKEYNPTIEEAIVAEYGEEFLTSKFADMTANVGSVLTDNRVYILTSSRTASASELIINSLKPYMDVFIIGNTTYGKNVGSISIFEENDPKNTWGMQPIVVKVFNSLDQSDYSDGFQPNILDKDNSLYIKPLGESDEALLKHAIDEITGASGGRIAATNARQMVGHSLDLKRRGFSLIIDEDESLLKKGVR
jgi:carboxyl-terminal processing protease